ncbi:GIY-YIG nuclease family protein [Arenibacter echinorum]|uniref:Putative endonuclease n=1 Tax=Arenibacter echinorum TaxID=440515 RepID=A0A327R546_9FLAO|nr:GIY-YIG nuclease family protein [Arenibacter echinorum]RAJ11355.1 putative endonuclease [Arenibacter echinorum]
MGNTNTSFQLFYNHFVYITTNEHRTTLYVGVTNHIQRRLSQHYFDSQNSKKSFAGKYNYIYLVYYEGFENPKDAIAREKEIKKWRREKKNSLVSSFNPKWESLNNQIV